MLIVVLGTEELLVLAMVVLTTGVSLNRGRSLVVLVVELEVLDGCSVVVVVVVVVELDAVDDIIVLGTNCWMVGCG